MATSADAPVTADGTSERGSPRRGAGADPFRARNAHFALNID
jgi:hypothetical protein